ncbi:type IV secretion system protein VirD4 [Pseudaminobacter salicylatoxidans]|uniref:Type IV secretion system protein VirD4 n=1 Tax=Pseudaminobacter salicylatoxidans TaxID=93369 RepID=A0A316BKG1_PSESE|nr:Ti-type conjugative transfer system protein TraG [Pseudaminobacter salicylatoxidans]PWJ73378.1 type IV secretion system protein VirD4 [Pseudaminobacter salicylatoxidans]
MEAKKLALMSAPIAVMLAILFAMNGIETWVAGFGKTPESYQTLGRIGLALPYVTAAAFGIIFLLATRGSLAIQSAGLGVLLGGAAVAAIGMIGETTRIMSMIDWVPDGQIGNYLDLYTLGGSAVALGSALFGLKVAMRGNMAFGSTGPKRLSGARAVHGANDWMSDAQAAKLFPASGGIVVGENYRPDKDTVGQVGFDPRRKDTWGKGGKAPLLCFDAGFGSTHGLVFAGSGGFKTTSVVIPTALKFKGTLIVLDPSTEIAPMVTAHRRSNYQRVFTLDPRKPEVGFNVLDWIGQHGNSPEEDIASVAAWLMSEKPRVSSGSDDFFRTTAEQLITAIIADVMLSEEPLEDDDEDEEDDELRTGEKSLRMVRKRLAQPEKTLQKKLEKIHRNTSSRFVRENVAPFINMTEQTFSGVYATATKETHWLSYDNYAALVSGATFKTEDIADGAHTIFINIDLSTLENHPGMARVIIGAFLKAVYNRNGDINERALFLLDEAARLGYMRIIETARDAGRKYGITLLMLFQSLGQMREAFGGRDATSKWFESASWVSFSAVNDTDTADYISKRCGQTTIEVDQVSRNTNGGRTGRSRSKQLTQRALILPYEVTQMRTDEQIIFTSGNPPIRCGRSIYFRRQEMASRVGASNFSPKSKADAGA